MTGGEPESSDRGAVQVFLLPSRAHDAAGGVAPITEQQVADFMCQNVTQNHMAREGAVLAGQFVKSVGEHIGLRRESTTTRPQRETEGLIGSVRLWAAQGDFRRRAPTTSAATSPTPRSRKSCVRLSMLTLPEGTIRGPKDRLPGTITPFTTRFGRKST